MSVFKNIQAFVFADEEKKQLTEESCAELAVAILNVLGSEDRYKMCSLTESLYNNDIQNIVFCTENGYSGVLNFNKDTGFAIEIINPVDKKDGSAKTLLINEALSAISF